MDVSPEQQLRAYLDYFRDLGVYDLYRQESPGQVVMPERWRELEARTRRQEAAAPAAATRQQVRPGPGEVAARAEVAARGMVAAPARAAERGNATAAATTPGTLGALSAAAAPPPVSTGLPEELRAPMAKPVSLDQLVPLPAEMVPPAQRLAALEAVRADIGDCTRCPLAYAGRRKIVFGDGDPNARLMFVGEGPGADEDEQGLPFVGKAGQLLNNMIAAMGLKREEVYIANVVKCRPPGNRTPEFAEASTCSQFLLRQIDIVRPEVIVALGSTAATYLLGVRQSLASLRGRWHAVRGAKVAVTYHPAFLLRDPRQKAEAWKDLQMVMAEMGLQAPARKAT